MCSSDLQAPPTYRPPPRKRQVPPLGPTHLPGPDLGGLEAPPRAPQHAAPRRGTARTHGSSPGASSAWGGSRRTWAPSRPRGTRRSRSRCTGRARSRSGCSYTLDGHAHGERSGATCGRRPHGPTPPAPATLPAGSPHPPLDGGVGTPGASRSRGDSFHFLTSTKPLPLSGPGAVWPGPSPSRPWACVSASVTGTGADPSRLRRAVTDRWEEPQQRPPGICPGGRGCVCGGGRA